MSGSWRIALDFARGIYLRVTFVTSRRDVTNYSVVLEIETERGVETIRVYDAAHGRNEMHRYGRSTGKQSATGTHSGTLGEGMRAAIEAIERNYEDMIDGWQRG